MRCQLGFCNLEPVDSFEKPVSLKAIKDVNALSGIALRKQPRLAVMSLAKNEFDLICAMKRDYSGS